MSTGRNLNTATEEVLEDLKKHAESLRAKEIFIGAEMAQCVRNFALESVKGNNSKESVDAYNALMAIYKLNYARCQALLDIVNAIIEQKSIPKEQQQILIKDPLFFHFKEDTKQFIQSYFLYEDASAFFAKAPEGVVSHLAKGARNSTMTAESGSESPSWLPSDRIKLSKRVWGKKTPQVSKPKSEGERSDRDNPISRRP